MSLKKLAYPTLACGVAVVVFLCTAPPLLAQDAKTHKPAAAQPNDEVYTKLIHDYLSDPRFTTELVDHLPASTTVPTPLKFLGTMPGQPGELYYSEDINRYFEALAKASPRAKFWKLPRKSEEGREMVVLAIGSEGAQATHLDLNLVLWWAVYQLRFSMHYMETCYLLPSQEPFLAQGLNRKGLDTF